MPKIPLPKDPIPLAVIGGSGLYDLADIQEVSRLRVKTPFGAPSDDIVVGVLSGVRCAFLPRHGRGHRFLPTEIPARANLYALKKLGVRQILGVGACGSLKEELAPRHFVIPDQIYDRTKHRVSTFFGDGIVAHVAFDQPFCGGMSSVLAECAAEAGVTVHRGGTYVCMEGPAFSTKAESQVNRAHGFSVVGMTVLPEAKLAREAEMCYATVSLVTDYDAWKEGEEVSAQKVIDTLNANVDNVKKLIRRAIPRLARLSPCPHQEALTRAVFTQPAVMPAATRQKLALLMGRHFPAR